MIRERLVRLALRAYPREVARARGPEMLSMTLDLADGSGLLFARELALLVFCGLRERSRELGASGRRQLLTDACSTALIVYLAVPLWGVLSRFRFLAAHDVVRSLGVLAICAAFLLLLAGYNRTVGIGGLCAIALGVTITVLQGRPPLDDVLSPFVTMAVPSVCCATLAVEPGRRPPRLARLWWFALVVLLALVLRPDPVHGPTLFGLGYQYGFLAVMSAIGILRLGYDPRLALGCGLVWASVGLRLGYGHLMFGVGGTDAILWVSAAILGAGALRLALMRPVRRA